MLLCGLYPLFDLCLIKHVLTVWPLTSTSACLGTKQCLMIFGRQTFPVWTDLKTYGGPYLQTQQSILETQHKIFETQVNRNKYLPNTTEYL